MAALSQEQWQKDVGCFMESVEIVYKQIVMTWARTFQQKSAYNASSSLATSQVIKRDTQISLQPLFSNCDTFLDTARTMLPDWIAQDGSLKQMRSACLEWVDEQIKPIKDWLMHPIGEYGKSKAIKTGFDNLANSIKIHVEQQLDQFQLECNASETVKGETVAQSMPFLSNSDTQQQKTRQRSISSPIPY